MDQRLRVADNQGEEDANMVTAVEDTRLLDRDVTMVRETETPRPATAPTGIARPTVRESPSLSEQHLQHRQQPHYSSQGSNSERESADEELQTEVRLRRAMERNGRLVDLTERMTTERDKAMRNPTHWNRSVLEAFVLDNANALVKSAADQSVNFRLAGPEQEVILSPLLDDNLARERMILMARMDQNIRITQVVRVYSREDKDLYYFMAVEAGMEMLKRREYRIDDWYRRRTETWGTLDTFLDQLRDSMTLAGGNPEQLQRFMTRYTGLARTLFFEGVISCILAVLGHPGNFEHFVRDREIKLMESPHAPVRVMLQCVELMHQAGLHVPLLHQDYFLRARDQARYHAERKTLANKVLEQERQREEQRERQITTIPDPQQTHLVRIKKPEAEPIPIEAIRKALGQIALEARPESLPKLQLEPPSQLLTTATTTVTTVAPKAAKLRRLDDPSITNPVPRVEEPQTPQGQEEENRSPLGLEGPLHSTGARLKTAPRTTAPQRGDVALSPIASAVPEPTGGAAGRMNFQSPFQPIQEENTLPFRSALNTEEQIREEIRMEKRATAEFLARYGISPTGGEERLARDINRLVENFERQQRDLIKRMEEKTALKIHDMLTANPAWTAARDLPGQQQAVGGAAGGGGGPGDNNPHRGHSRRRGDDQDQPNQPPGGWQPSGGAGGWGGPPGGGPPDEDPTDPSDLSSSESDDRRKKKKKKKKEKKANASDYLKKKFGELPIKEEPEDVEENCREMYLHQALSSPM